jgi:hypothetical protein
MALQEERLKEYMVLYLLQILLMCSKSVFRRRETGTLLPNSFKPLIQRSEVVVFQVMMQSRFS